MNQDQLIQALSPIVYNRAMAESESGKNAIRSHIMTYLRANYSENELANSNININLILGGTRVNDINSQAQSELQIQVDHS